jgi:hypothetical protein
LFNAYDLIRSRRAWDTDTAIPGIGWVPARPLGGLQSRFKLAWMVFTGRADVLHWPGQE